MPRGTDTDIDTDNEHNNNNSNNRENESQSLLHSSTQRARESARRNWNVFVDFALRDNVLEVAVGLM
jgi:hypothetical protein